MMCSIAIASSRILYLVQNPESRFIMNWVIDDIFSIGIASKFSVMPISVPGDLANSNTHRFMGIAKKEMKLTMETQQPMPLAPYEIPRRP